MGCFSGPTTTTKNTSNQTGTNTQDGTFNTNNTSTNNGTNQQTNTGQTNTQSTSSTNPNLPDWFMPFKQAIAGQYGQNYQAFGQMAQHPLYGPQQQANFQEQLNRQTGSANNNLMSSLASRGALNSGNAAQSQVGLALGSNQALQNYLAQIPMLNQQAKTQALQGQQGALNGAGNLSIPYGQTTTSNSTQDMISQLIGSFTNNGSSNSNGTTSQNGSSSQTGNSTQTQQTSGGMLQSILGGLINAGLGAATGGLSSAFSGLLGGSKGPSAQTVNSLPQYNNWNNSMYSNFPGFGNAGGGF